MNESTLVDICLYYDRFQDGAALPNGSPGAKQGVSKIPTFWGRRPKVHPDAVWSTAQIQDDLSAFGISFRVTQTTGVIAADVAQHHWYVIEPFFISQCFRQNQSVLRSLSRDTLKMLRSGKLSLVIWYPKEAHDLEMDNWFALLNEGVKKLGIKNCILYFSDMNVKENSRQWSVKHSIPLSITPRAIDYWFDSHQNLMASYVRHNESGTFLRPESHLRDRPRPKHYLCLNAVAKAHRVILLNDLEQNNLIAHGYQSLLFRYGSTINKADFHAVVDEFYQVDEEERERKVKQIENFLSRHHPGRPLVLDRSLTDYGDNDRVHQAWTYQDTYCSVVTESVVNDDIFFLTEKTYKCFHFLHPFILFGSVGSLAHLRQMGFETFPDWFDESYDSEPDLRKRYQLVLKNIQTLCRKDLGQLHKLYQDSWERLEYNWEHFLLKKRKHDLKETVLGTQYHL